MTTALNDKQASVPPSNFGASLKTWRNQRRMSQLDLGLSANVSPRHISFLETGRSAPSKRMIHHLCECLDVPPADRNNLLSAAGFAPAYQNRALSDDDMTAVREAVEWTLDRHNPYPAMALDRHWRLVKANDAAKFMLAASGVNEGDSLLTMLDDPEKLPETFENWEEVTTHAVIRLRTESAHLGGDTVLDEAAERLSKILGDKGLDGQSNLPPFVPTRYRAGEMVLSFLSTIAQFGTANDIALSELKIELMFPADETTRAVLVSMASD